MRKDKGKRKMEGEEKGRGQVRTLLTCGEVDEPGRDQESHETSVLKSGSGHGKERGGWCQSAFCDLRKTT